jgi:hypothetical protein
MLTTLIDPPYIVGSITLVRWIEGNTYESDAGVTYYSGEAEPSEADAEDCLATPRTPPPGPPVPRTITKLTLKSRLDAIDKWTDFKTACITLGAWDDFLMAQDVRTDNPLFTAAAPQLKASLNLTDAQFDVLLA